MRRIEIVEAPARRVFAVAYRGPYAEIGHAFGCLTDLLAEHGLHADAGNLIGVYYDNPDTTAAADLRAHAGVEVGETAVLPPGLQEVRLAAGRQARLRVLGPYAGLQPAYAWLHDEGLAAAGLDRSGAPSFEVYHNTPFDTPPEALVTDIFVPVA